MKIAACYIRVSTDEQSEYSPQSQLKELRKYAEQHEYYIPDEYIFTDEGISGRSAEKRPQFQQLIATARSKPKPFDAVLLWKFSRFARNRTDAIVYKNLLRNECGIDVISISESLGDDKGTAVILESMFEAMDEYYSINLSAEVKRSMQMLAENGAALGPAPFGYKNENKQYVIDESTVDTVKMIFDLFESGKGPRTIALQLSGMGIKTKRGKIPDNRFVEYILQNPFYIGYIRWSDGKANNRKRYKTAMGEEAKIYKGKHEPIIKEEQFNKVQEIFNERARMYQKYQRKEPTSPRMFMLKGLVRCSSCNGTLVLSSAVEPAMQCHNYSRCSCHVSHYITIKKANKIVIETLKRFAETLQFDVLPLEQKKEPEVKTIEKILESEKKKLIKIKEAYEEGVDTLDEYRENKQRVTKRINEIETELNKSLPVKIDKKDYAKKISAVLEVLVDPTETEVAKSRAIRTIVSKIIYHKPTNEFQVFLYC